MCLCKPEIRTPWCDDCQSFAYQRIKELEDKLSKCQEIAMGLGIKYNEQQDKLKIAVDALCTISIEGGWLSEEVACNALEEIGELK